MYQALYRKYRSQTFDEVVGQSGVTDTLKAQIAAGRTSHAYLFTGTRGTGKTSCARIMAKAVNCENNQDGNPCNQCAACRMIDADACVDVLEIDAASNNGVDQIRALREEAVYSPAQVKKRIYIVDEVHMLSGSAFNALLKIVEEPPEHLMFILATTELHKVPATILSRCQRFSFRRLQQEDIAKHLGYVAYQEGIDLQPDAAELLANLGDGAMRDALSLLDQCASAAKGTVTSETVCNVLGLAGRQNTAQLLHAMADGDAAAALTLFSDLYSAGKDLSAMLGEIGTLARDLLVLRTAPKAGAGMLSGVSTAQEREELLKKLSPAELLRIVSVVQRTTGGFSASTNRRLDAEVCIMELCSPALSQDNGALSARLGKLEEKIASGDFAVAAPAAQAAPIKAQQAPTPAPVREKPAAPPPEALPADFWPEFVAWLKPELPQHLSGFFSVSGPVQPKLKGDTLLLETDQFTMDLLKEDQNLRQALSQKAAAVLKSPVRVQFSVRGQNGMEDGDPMDELMKYMETHGL